jgi:6,7-dimethyl-8-ribityllumazine synthase
MNLGVVVSEFNSDVTYLMLERAKEHAAFLGATVKEVVKVPGVYDMPVAAKALLARVDIDGVVALGAVIEGETRHDEIIMQQATRKLMDLSVETGKPVGLGITGHGMTRLQALDRIDNAKQAVESAVKMNQRLRELRI